MGLAVQSHVGSSCNGDPIGIPWHCKVDSQSLDYQGSHLPIYLTAINVHLRIYCILTSHSHTDRHSYFPIFFYYSEYYESIIEQICTWHWDPVFTVESPLIITHLFVSMCTCFSGVDMELLDQRICFRASSCLRMHLENVGMQNAPFFIVLSWNQDVQTPEEVRSWTFWMNSLLISNRTFCDEEECSQPLSDRWALEM